MFHLVQLCPQHVTLCHHNTVEDREAAVTHQVLIVTWLLNMSEYGNLASLN